MVIITYNGSFEIIAAGHTTAHAERTFRKAWAKHKAQTGATWSATEALAESNTFDIVPGEAIRDLSPFIEDVK